MMSVDPMDMISISLVYLTTDSQTLLQREVAQDTTLRQAVLDSRLLEQHQLTWPLPVGVFSQRIDCPDSYRLQAGDRVELYRPLTRDPKDVRRQRAERHPVGRRIARRSTPSSR